MLISLWEHIICSYWTQVRSLSTIPTHSLTHSPTNSFCWILGDVTLAVRRHFVPTTHCPTGIFRATNCPRRQNVKLSPGDKMSHFEICPKLAQDMSNICLINAQPLPKVLAFKLTKWDNRQNVPTTFLCISASVGTFCHWGESGTFCRLKNARQWFSYGYAGNMVKNW